ncbi:MAG TPA: hypothetical protein EYP33_01465 [Pyrodictium sp.]|nr:hypothetical protein [Pyrodictium sp.]
MPGLEEQLGLNNPATLDNYLNLVADVYSRIEGFLNLYDTIRRETATKPLTQLVMDNRYLELLLGGLRDDLDKPFPEDAMAKFTADILGVRVAESTAKEIVARVRSSETLQDACRDLQPEILEEPEHITLLWLLAKELREALEKTGRTPTRAPYVSVREGGHSRRSPSRHPDMGPEAPTTLQPGILLHPEPLQHTPLLRPTSLSKPTKARTTPGRKTSDTHRDNIRARHSKPGGTGKDNNNRNNQRLNSTKHSQSNTYSLQVVPVVEFEQVF